MPSMRSLRSLRAAAPRPQAATTGLTRHYCATGLASCQVSPCSTLLWWLACCSWEALQR